MADQPLAADNKPKKVELEKGEAYYWCACGRSGNQPFCDGSHKGTGLAPKKFVASEGGDAFLCLCKKTQNPPYCDGSHKNISADQVVKPRSNQEAPEATPTPEEPHVSLIITGGLRTPADFAKALALGADAIAVSNSAMQAIGCVGARMCNTNNCPAGIATQKPELRKKIKIDDAAKKLHRFFSASTDLMKILARACGHSHINEFKKSDLTTWKKEMSELSGVPFAGI